MSEKKEEGKREGGRENIIYEEESEYVRGSRRRPPDASRRAASSAYLLKWQGHRQLHHQLSSAGITSRKPNVTMTKDVRPRITSPLVTTMKPRRRNPRHGSFGFHIFGRVDENAPNMDASLDAPWMHGCDLVRGVIWKNENGSITLGYKKKKKNRNLIRILKPRIFPKFMRLEDIEVCRTFAQTIKHLYNQLFIL